MTDDHTGLGGQSSGGDDLVEIDLNFESMRRFQAEFSPNLSKGGLFIDTGEPLVPGSVVRFRVILPEEFVFLEGTAVVEWVRNAEAVSDGPPGMALRFVTLSPQNQELVEQLVQDHIDAGGTPFDLDVRPVPADYPTDSLEGVPAPATGSVDEGYKLTLRHTGPSLQAEALQALAEVIPEDGEEDSTTEDDVVEPSEAVEAKVVPSDESGEATPADKEESVTAVDEESHVEDEESPVEEVHDFEIVSAEAAAANLEAAPDVEDPAAEEMTEEPSPEEVVETEIVGDPPEFDWSAEPDESVSAEVVVEAEPEVTAEEDPADVATEAPVDVMDGPTLSFDLGDGRREIEEKTEPEETVAIPDVLPTPSAFDEGPEVIEDVPRDDLGSPAFDVSLPEHDDEPDSTPVLPDEGGGDVMVTTEDDVVEPPRRRPRWPLALAAVFVLAVGGGLLWPHAKDWLSSRDAAPAVEPVAVESAHVEQEAQNPVGDERPAEQVEIAASSDAGTEIPEAVEDPGTAAVEEVIPEPTPAMVRLEPADTVSAIEVEAGQPGTVIRIRANGSLEDGVFSMETLPSPPRILIRLRGITNSYRPYTIEAMTPEVTRVRSGLHEERRPSELWIVVDLTGSDVASGGVSLSRDLAEIVIARP